MHTHTLMHIHTYAHTLLCTHTLMHTHTYAHTNLCTHTLMHTHTLAPCQGDASPTEHPKGPHRRAPEGPRGQRGHLGGQSAHPGVPGGPGGSFAVVHLFYFQGCPGPQTRQAGAHSPRYQKRTAQAHEGSSRFKETGHLRASRPKIFACGARVFVLRGPGPAASDPPGGGTHSPRNQLRSARSREKGLTDPQRQP